MVFAAIARWTSHVRFWPYGVILRRRLIWPAAAFVLSATALHAALPTDTATPDADTSGRTSFAGKLLIAAPEMRAPFDHAVVLLAQHDRNGALGIIINHPLGSRPIARVLEAMGADASGITASVPIFLGGPVSPDIGFVLHSADYHRSDTLDVDGRVALTSAADVLRDIGTGKGPHKSLVAFGYAGWGAAQLEDEMGRGAWLVAADDPALVFDDDRANVWADALQKNGR